MKLRFRFLHSNKHWVTVPLAAVLGWWWWWWLCVLLQILERFRKLFKCYIQLKKQWHILSLEQLDIIKRTASYWLECHIYIMKLQILFSPFFISVSVVFEDTNSEVSPSTLNTNLSFKWNTDLHNEGNKIIRLAGATLAYYHHFCSIPSSQSTLI